jgi:hypothetical protein
MSAQCARSSDETIIVSRRIAVFSFPCCELAHIVPPYGRFITLTNASPRRPTMALQQNYTCSYIQDGHRLYRTCRPEALCRAEPCLVAKNPVPRHVPCVVAGFNGCVKVSF